MSTWIDNKTDVERLMEDCTGEYPYGLFISRPGQAEGLRLWFRTEEARRGYVEAVGTGEFEMEIV